MAFIQRMNVIVGDQNTVARYLTEKIGHVALIAWALALLFGIEPLNAALAAALAYDLTGKAIWYWQHRTFDPGDALFDLVVCLFPAVIALPLRFGWFAFAIGFLVWVVFILIGSNNQIGSPS